MPGAAVAGDVDKCWHFQPLVSFREGLTMMAHRLLCQQQTLHEARLQEQIGEPARQG